MTKHWPLVPLGEILNKSQDWIGLEAEAQYKEVTVKLWGRGVVLRRIVVGAEIAASSRLRVHANQFILSRIDARNGACGVVPAFLDGAVVSNDFPIYILNPDRVLPGFLGWLSKTNAFIESCRAASEGTTNRVRLKEDQFLKIEIPLPRLGEQRRIVANIDRLAAKIEEARTLCHQSITNVDSFVTSVHLSLAGNRFRQIGDILKLAEDEVPVSPDKEYPQVGVKGFGGGLFSKPPISGAQTTYRTFNCLFDGALVLSQVKGWEGAVAVCDRSLSGRFVSPEYRTFRCVPIEAIPDYLSVLVRTKWFWNHLRYATRGVGARRERTRPEEFLALSIPMPDVRHQAKGVSIFRGINVVRSLQAQTSAELDAMLPSILDKAFKGKL